MMVETYPNLKEEAGGLNPGCEISSLLDKNLVLAYQPSVSKRNVDCYVKPKNAIISSIHFLNRGQIPTT